MAAKLKKGDRVVVRSGRDKGKSGEILRVYPDDDRVLVAGVNLVKRHQKQTARVQGGIITKEAPLHRSKVAYADPESGGPTRIGFKKGANGDMVRFAKKTEITSMAEKTPAKGDAKAAAPAAANKAPPTKKENKAEGKKASASADKTGGQEARDPNYTPRFKKRYFDVVRPELAKQFGYKNQMQVPRIEKIVLNIGAGEGAADQKKIQSAQNDLTAIAGQKAVITRAKKAISAFKITAGRPVGVKVTLRKDRMYEFLDRLVTMALPRVRDFRGVSGKSFDGKGNYAMGLKEHIVFLEIDYDRTETVWGMDIIIQTSAKTDAEAKALLAAFQMPFVN